MSSNIFSKLLLGILILNPLIYLGSSEFPKFVFVIVFSEVLLILYLFVLKKIVIDLKTKLVLLYLAINFLADIMGLDPKISLLGTPTRHQGFLLLIIVSILLIIGNQIHDKKLLDKIKTAILASSILLSLISLFEAIFFYLFKYYVPNIEGRISSTMGNPNFLGGYLVITLPFLLWSRINNKLKLIIFLINYAVIFLTFSRSAILATLLILLVYFYNKFGIYKLLLFSGVLIFSIFGVSYFIPNLASSFNRNSIWENRTILWSNAASSIYKNPFLGYGQENFELVFPHKLRINVDNSHNIFLETVLSSGLLGLFLFILIIYKSSEEASLTKKLSILAFIIVSFFNPVSVAEIVLFWFLLGVKL